MSWRGARRSDRPRFDDAAKDEASRFLFSDIDPRPRIRGLGTVSECTAWIEVELTRESPRKVVIGALNTRSSVLRGDADASGEATADGEVSA